MNDLAHKEMDIKKLHDRMSELEVRIGQLNLEKCNFMDIIKQQEQKHKELEKDINKRETWITQL